MSRKKLIGAIVRLSAEWRTRARLFSDDELARCREIGLELYKLDGMDLMLKARAVVREQNGYVAALWVSIYWHGIGEWTERNLEAA